MYYIDIHKRMNGTRVHTYGERHCVIRDLDFLDFFDKKRGISSSKRLNHDAMEIIGCETFIMPTRLAFSTQMWLYRIFLL